MVKLTSLKELILFVDQHWKAVCRFFITLTVVLIMAFVIKAILSEIPSDEERRRIRLYGHVNSGCILYKDDHYICDEIQR